MKRKVAVTVLLAAVVAGVLWVAGRPGVIDVPAGTSGTSMSSIIAGAPEGTLLRLLPGQHFGFEVDRRLTIQGLSGSTVTGPVSVSADGTRLVDLRVVGGETGISVRGAIDVTIEGASVVGAELHGIEVVSGSAVVRGCTIEGLMSPYAQGFEVRNSTGLPHTVVEGCRISSGQEGLVAHVARVEFRDNMIVGTTQRAIAVTEMSEGLVENNRVHDVSGSGLYCGDMSHCDFRSNAVDGVAPNPGGAAWQQGYGVVGIYHSKLMLFENSFDAIAADGPMRLSLEAEQTEKSPLVLWPQGWRGAIPSLWISAIGLGGLAAVIVGARPVVRRRSRRLEARHAPEVRPVAAVTAIAIWAGVLVQGIHMVEHVVQVIQVYVVEASVRSGLLGAVVDTEWVHFVYNAAVLVFLAAVAIPAWTGRFGSRALASAGAALVASFAIQIYHFGEHVAKVAQHVASGATPAPGLVGGRLGLVWFHFGINLAVYVGLVIGVVRLGRSGVFEALSGRGRDAELREAGQAGAATV